MSLSRRTVLRGLLGGSAVALALPTLEAMCTANGNALAASGSFPCRFGLYFWGNGVLPDRWVPATTGADYDLPVTLAPLAPVRQHVSVVSGLEVKLQNTTAHGTGIAGILTGANVLTRGESYTFEGPSLDQRIAAEIGDATAFRSIEVGVQPGGRGLSHNAPDSRNTPESDPLALFERLFGPTFRQPGESSIVDPSLAVRRSVLDAVLADAASLSAKLGSADKARLDQHMSAVRDLELRIAGLEEDPPDLAACARPDEPVALPDVDGRPQMQARAELMADLSVMALACDLTRVLSIWHSDPLSNVLYPQATAGHHQLTHDEPGNQPQVEGILDRVMQSFAYTVSALAAVPEGEGTLLDHCAILGTSDVSYGRTHSIDEYPVLVAGTAGGALVNGVHLRSDAQGNVGQVPLTLMRALGIPAASFGSGSAETTASLSGLEA